MYALLQPCDQQQFIKNWITVVKWVYSLPALELKYGRALFFNLLPLSQLYKLCAVVWIIAETIWLPAPPCGGTRDLPPESISQSLCVYMFSRKVFSWGKISLLNLRLLILRCVIHCFGLFDWNKGDIVYDAKIVIIKIPTCADAICESNPLLISIALEPKKLVQNLKVIYHHVFMTIPCGLYARGSRFLFE